MKDNMFKTMWAIIGCITFIAMVYRMALMWENIYTTDPTYKRYDATPLPKIEGKDRP